MTDLKSAETPSPAHKSGHSVEEALGNLLAMLPSAPAFDSIVRADERVPAGFCYVRWIDIIEARAALSRARGES
jgi:hypothetical protein